MFVLTFVAALKGFNRPNILCKCDSLKHFGKTLIIRVKLIRARAILYTNGSSQQHPSILCSHKKLFKYLTLYPQLC